MSNKGMEIKVYDVVTPKVINGEKPDEHLGIVVARYNTGESEFKKEWFVVKWKSRVDRQLFRTDFAQDELVLIQRTIEIEE